MMQDKRVRWSWDYLQSMTENENLYLLTEREVQFLLTPLSVANWATRWFGSSVPSEDERQELIAIVQERLLTPMDICALIVDCIENSESVQEALRKFNNANGIPNGNGGANPFGVGIGEDNILNGLSCSFDNIYGSCVAIVDYVEQTARDFVEVVLSDANAWGRIARAIDFIPLIGDLPILDDLNDLIAWFAVNGTIAFDAGYTVGLRQELICDMFESACASCNLTPYAVYSAYAQNAGIPLNPEDVFQALVTNMLGLTGNTAFAMGVCAMVAGALASGGAVLGLVGLHGLTTIAASGNPDGDWSLYCEDCDYTPTGCVEYNFTANNQGWSIASPKPYGQYVADTGFQPTLGESVYQLWTLRTGMSENFTVTRVEVDYIAIGGTGSRYARIQGYQGSSPMVEVTFPQYVNDNMDRTMAVDVNWVNFNGLRFYAYTFGSASNSLTIKRIRVYYDTDSGTPDGGSPC
jgi:hypothetical protein